MNDVIRTSKESHFKALAKEFIKADEQQNGSLPVNLQIAINQFARWLDERSSHETNALLNPQDERGAAILGLEEILRHMPSKDGRWALEYAISKLRPAQKAVEPRRMTADEAAAMDRALARSREDVDDGSKSEPDGR